MAERRIWQTMVEKFTLTRPTIWSVSVLDWYRLFHADGYFDNFRGTALYISASVRDVLNVVISRVFPRLLS